MDLENVKTLTSVPTEDWRDESLAVWEVGVLGIILVVTLMGNALVLFAIYLRRCRGRRQRLTRMHFFVMHLSTADLVTGLLNVLPQLAWDITFRFKGGSILCKLIKYGQPLGPYLSSYILIATAIDRYHAICYPLSYCRTTSRRSRLTVYCAWTLALLFCLPQVFIFSFKEISTGVWDCWATFIEPYGLKAYVTWYSITVFLLPFCVLTFTYTEICLSIWRNREVSLLAGMERHQALSNQAHNQNSFISKAKINTVKQTLAVVILYTASSVPFVGCQLWASWDPAAENSSFLNGPIFTILSLLSSLTSCVNPWIYLTFSYELRVTLTKFLRSLIKRDRSSSFERVSSNLNSNETKSSKRSSLIPRMSRYTSFIIYRSNTNERNDK
ncbi:cephalotocin receptor 1-like [Phymastichus coffea]|uniref:cephalotocin receptor 1-like n=1 Tax=Phymastichus coffea TaxID=108790 RepID=UPI00273B40B7|nr:cephalotocin receptor 1-like [Phymastichus coffea]XP_058796715.1 cephalotocin receptor 1-like [Phymastichus coffea]XP_058796716.1 cephalotocin receptor 1-like [Phymastichus coffea]XP_058796717.1 cephalotocin receptor 1-like [Phymastichus coffea]XP_058796718.1 cephalotocin receptor 1-like [Phymastichus coffea]XP_058796719.1 cephalotocin receptor 1-like [Phymastichus coffea]